MKRRLNIVAMVMAVGLATSCGSSQKLGSDRLFKSPANDTIPYRIPAIAQASNGNLIAVADYRHSREDIGVVNNGRIDLHGRISTNNGADWGSTFTIVEGKGADSPDFMHVGFGDPCIVADRESSRVLMLSCAGNVSFQNGTRQNHQCIARFYSDDCGKTWSAPQDIAESIYSQFDNSNYGPVRSMFVASGRIFQSRTVKVNDYYRLYAAVLVRDRSATHMNYVIYSDDFGQTWQLLGNVNTPAVYSTADEPKVEELPDGSLLISSRYTGGRYYNIYAFTDKNSGSGLWLKAAFSGGYNGGVEAIDNSTNGEVMVLPVVRTADSEPMHLLLQSLPFGPQRTHVGIYYKPLESSADVVSPERIAENWEGRFEITPRTSAYSTMALQSDGSIGFLYEEDELYDRRGGGYSIIYDNFSVEQITEGKYSYNPKSSKKLWKSYKK